MSKASIWAVLPKLGSSHRFPKENPRSTAWQPVPAHTGLPLPSTPALSQAGGALAHHARSLHVLARMHGGKPGEKVGYS